MVNTEQDYFTSALPFHYNILNIVVNTELIRKRVITLGNYNILNIVVNTEQLAHRYQVLMYYNILNIVVNTELFYLP